jgi:hypothetical protein
MPAWYIFEGCSRVRSEPEMKDVQRERRAGTGLAKMDASREGIGDFGSEKLKKTTLESRLRLLGQQKDISPMRVERMT